MVTVSTHCFSKLLKGTAADYYSLQHKILFYHLDYNWTESSALIFPFNLQCVETRSWSEIKLCFIAYFTVYEYAVIIPGLMVVSLPSCCQDALVFFQEGERDGPHHE